MAPGTVAETVHSPVAALLREVAARVILPRFRNLRDGDIIEKTPGELVTVADREAEIELAHGLPRIIAARVIGEEACAEDPSLLHDLDRGAIWIVDPIDGTGNFAAGREPFGIIVALAIDGVTEAGWLYDPVADRLCHAVRGQGAWIDGVRLRCPPPRARPVAALATQFMTPALRDTLVARADEVFDIVPIPRCAAEHYPRLATGGNDIGLFQRTLPWDHAAGALLLTEAGGHVARWDGTPYMFHDDGVGILAATSAELWRRAASQLFAGDLNDARVINPQTLDA